MFGNHNSIQKKIEKALHPLLRTRPGASVSVRMPDDKRVLIALACASRAEGEALLPDVQSVAEKAAGGATVHVVVSSEKNANTPKQFIAVASGKGGVGKSTVTMNVARCLQSMGVRVGVLDADIYGPSIPKMTKLEGQKLTGEKGRINPVYSDEGICIMSIGFMVADPDAPLIWRGPMLHGALNQLLHEVLWADQDGNRLDVVLIDMPPGTGDVALTLTQKANLAGAIVVTTPQDMALIDARKAAGMFTRMDIPILGVVENMATYCCPECGYEDAIFDTQGGQKEADNLNVPYLGSIPLSRPIRQAADAGQAADLALYQPVAEALNILIPSDDRQTH